MRAYNQMGDGQPVYESVRTKEEQSLKVTAPLLPPVGLEAVVLSAQSVIVYWTDSQLAKTQVQSNYPNISILKNHCFNSLALVTNERK